MWAQPEAWLKTRWRSKTHLWHVFTMSLEMAHYWVAAERHDSASFCNRLSGASRKRQAGSEEQPVPADCRREKWVCYLEFGLTERNVIINVWTFVDITELKWVHVCSLLTTFSNSANSFKMPWEQLFNLWAFAVLFGWNALSNNGVFPDEKWGKAIGREN